MMLGVPKGHYIFEFNAGTKNNEHIDNDGSYIQHYPGFLKPGFHPKGLGVPCCFRFWDKGGQPKRRELFLKGTSKTTKSKSKSDLKTTSTADKSTEGETSTMEPKEDEIKETIHSITNFPLKNKTIGYYQLCSKMLGENYDMIKLDQPIFFGNLITI